MSTYTVQVFRDSGQWIIEVPGLDVVGQTRTQPGQPAQEYPGARVHGDPQPGPAGE